MSTPDRIVRHLRLRAPAEAHVRAAVLGLEDALRCASLPDVGERLLLVRRLNLGRLPQAISSQALSQLIEQRVRELGGTWVHGGQDGAVNANTVFFASRLEAAQIALRRRARGLNLAAWYWPRALPGVAVGAWDADFLHQLVSCLAREPSAPAILPALLADAVAHGALPWLVQHAKHHTISHLLTTTRAQRHLPAVPAPSAGGHVPPAWLDGQSEIAIGRVGPPLWLIAVLRTANMSLHPEDFAAPLPPRAAAGGAALPTVPVRRAEARRGKRREAPEGATPVDNLRADKRTPTSVEALVSRTAPAETRRTAEIGSESTASRIEVRRQPQSEQLSGRREDCCTTSEAYAPLEQPPFDASRPTNAGGLLFLINVLGRLGFPAWQERHAGTPLCGLILGEALRRLRVGEGDPAWALVNKLPTPESTEPRRWASPPLWTDPRIGLGLPEDLPITPPALSTRWLTACRRYLRRVAHTGLASLCLRPARLDWTATHIDVILPLAATDLRVRREGLDIDPGWLDWLGRVVSFHYLDERP